jgi:hypothetical protein
VAIFIGREGQMGAIFNTQRTLNILSMLSRTYDRTGLPYIRQNDQHHTADLRRPIVGVNPLSTYQFCKDHRVITGDGGTDTRWNTWLDYFDAHTTAKAQQVRNDMAAAIDDQNCVGIEFFAVPAPKFDIQPTFRLPETKASANPYTLIVTVFTPLIDQLP